MQAYETNLLRFLEPRNQFFIPIFQRRYSWGKRQCEQLWNDVLRIGKNRDIPSHFFGSIVYMADGVQSVASVSRLLVIDGQQRLTTLSLLILALGKAIEEQGNEIGITLDQLSSFYLFNDKTDGELHYKLLLTGHDKETLIQLLENRERSDDASRRLVENCDFFEAKLKQVDLKAVYAGIQKLMIVDIALDHRYDNPQLIYESLNSTGLELSEADLIRNYVLMGQPSDQQDKLYEHYWFPMEQRFGDEYAKWFDWFIRDYLTLETRQIPNIKRVYEKFKAHIPSTVDLGKLEMIIADIARYSKHYVKFVLLQEEDPDFRECFEDINELGAGVARPFLLEVYEDYAKGQIEKVEMIEILRLVESYIFRRSICSIPTNILNKIFASLMVKVDKSNYVESLKSTFSQLPYRARYPQDDEFKQKFLLKDVYNFNRRNYLLRKLENYERKESISITDYTTEHVMPQNSNLSEAWQQELGANWQEIQEKYLHTVGNLTLTGYNSELSDHPFKEKQCICGGFRDSPLRLNRSLAQTDQWNENTITARAEELTEKALKIWISPE